MSNLESRFPVVYGYYRSRIPFNNKKGYKKVKVPGFIRCEDDITARKVRNLLNKRRGLVWTNRDALTCGFIHENFTPKQFQTAPILHWNDVENFKLFDFIIS